MSASGIDLIEATTPSELVAFRRLLEDYMNSDTRPCLASGPLVPHELIQEFGPPKGRLFLAELAGKVVGCVGIRALPSGAGEMRRLYVHPDYRGAHIGRMLAEAGIEAARELGFRFVSMDAPCDRKPMLSLAQSLGFREVADSFEPRPGGVLRLQRAI
jgi:ribosomal protein S18 acetylase RimI-like enzyme